MVLTGPVIRRRLAACMLAFFVLFLILSVRLFILQGVQAEDLQRRAQAQWTSESAVRPRAAKSSIETAQCLRRARQRIPCAQAQGRLRMPRRSHD